MFTFELKLLTEAAEGVNHRRANELGWDGALPFISHVSLKGRKLLFKCRKLMQRDTSAWFPAISARMRVGTKSTQVFF